MNIVFVLPRFECKVSGGFKIVYEYANRFADRGNNVSIFFINERGCEKYRFPKFVKRMISNVFTQIEPRWFPLDKRVTKISGTGNKGREYLLNCKADVAIATAADTFWFVEKNFTNCRKAYFVQDFENWVYPDEELKKTFATSCKKIVIANWLKDIVDRCSPTKSFLICDPIDRNTYKIIRPLEKREKHSVGFLFHERENKGVKYTLAVIEKLKKRYHDLVCYSFGVFDRPSDFPDYIIYKQSASVEETVEVYNNVRVFLCSTIFEGFGLTGLEAMACGAVLVSSEYKGVLEYAEHMQNALLSPVKDIEAMYENAVDVFENETLLRKLSAGGVEKVKAFYDWDSAVDRFLDALGQQ